MRSSAWGLTKRRTHSHTHTHLNVKQLYMDLYLCVCVWHHGAPSDCADSTACLFLLKGTKNLKNFNENPRELGIYANNLMVPLSLPPSLSLLQMQLLMEPATYLSQQISAHAPTQNRFDTRPRWAQSGPGSGTGNGNGAGTASGCCPCDQRN